VESKVRQSRKLIKSASIVIIITVLAKITGFVREMVMGSVFGTGNDSGIYFWAMGITTVIYIAFASAISSSMLPSLNELRINHQDDELKRYNNKLFTLGILVSIILIAILEYFAPFYVAKIANKYQGVVLHKAIVITRLLIPTILFIVLAYISKTILQANEKFFMYSIISLPYNILIIMYLIFFANKYGIYGLAVTTIFAWSSQFFIQIPTLSKLNVRYSLDFNYKDKEIKKFMILIFPLLISALIYSINTLVDKSVALQLVDGGKKVSALTYGYNIYSSIVTTIILGITTVLYPKFIEAKLLQNDETFKKNISDILSVMLYISLPLMFCFIILNRQIVEIAYMRGKFDIESVILTKNALLYYSLATIGYTIQEVLLKLFFSLKEVKVPMYCSTLSVVINIVLNVILSRYFDYVGLALATSISIIVNATALFIMLEKKIGKINKKKIIVTFVKLMLALIVSSIVINIIMKMFYVTSAKLLINIFIVAIGVIVAGIIYLILTYLMGVEETKFLLKNYLKIRR